ncbi:MAG: molybdopterin-dependent oxidoreductase [Caulobacteraceae bacterium]|nr:molybdopterin-dependent oxidoreductase [Caulobacteraceae bacterium]
MRRASAALTALVLLIVPSAAASAPAADLVVVGLGGETTTMTPARLADLPRAEATLHEGAKTSSYEGPTLTAILREARTPTGPRAHGAPMRAYVTVTGADGYAVVLSLAETDPEFRTGPVVLADKADGAPLDARQGPYRLVIGDDLKPWRAVRTVVRIEVREAPGGPPPDLQGATPSGRGD